MIKRTVAKTPEQELVEFLKRQKGKEIEIYVEREAIGLRRLQRIMEEEVLDYLRNLLVKSGKRVPASLNVIIPAGGFYETVIEEGRTFEQPASFEIFVKGEAIANGEMSGYGEYMEVNGREEFWLSGIILVIMDVSA